jgi:D-arginine dehydrogenase
MKTADIVIVGAGAAGATLAAELAGETQVIVVEAEKQAGYHASGRSAAVFVPSYGHGLLRRLTTHSRVFYDQSDPEFFPAPLLSQRGLLRVVLEGGAVQHQAVTGDVPGIRALSPAEAVECFPLLNVDRILHASLEPDVHDIDVEALIQGSLRKARKHGAAVQFASLVTGIERKDGAWTVTTGNGRIQCTTLVNATGVWANRTAELAGLRPVELDSCRRSVAVLPLPPALENRTAAPFTVTVPLRWYAKTEQTSLLVSPADEDPVPPHDAFADDMIIAEGLHRFSEDTGFEVRRVIRSWAGLRSIAPDEYPVVGFDPEAPGFFWLAGQAGFGIQCAPGIARLAAAEILGSEMDNELATAFGVERMRRG